MRETLRFITCGSVDDGKSTLIGRLLWESKLVFEDQLSALAKDSTRWGTQGEAIDYALLLDGLQAEREQGITIDVAYRFFATPNRRFVVADTPGHEQYTRNMATGASNSDLAVLLVNAKRGLMVQTHRHTRIVSLLGIRHLVMAVNKMDLVDWREEVFANIVSEFEPLIKDLGFETFQVVPISALNGDNIIGRSEIALWYKGPALLPYLENIDITRHEGEQPFRMAVQYVNRPNQDFRGFCGRIASGVVRPGDRVRVIPGGMETAVKSIAVWQCEIPEARSEESVTLCLEDELDVTRGCVIASADDPISESDQFETRLLAMSEHALVPGRSYLLKLHTSQAVATITSIKYVVDVKEGHHLAAKQLAMNDIGVVNISTDRLLPFEKYNSNRRLGSFILVDRHNNQTVGAGMIDFSLRRAANLHWQPFKINRLARAQQKLQTPACIWLTGLSGSGKSTIANLLEQRMFCAGKHTYLLDGDNIRHGLNRDLGFTEADRVENLRRVSEVARLFVDAGLIVIVSFISPFQSERELARSHFEEGAFIEVFVDTPIDECERRDAKGLYAKARRGELINFTGVDSPYEPPESPEIHLRTMEESPDECVERILHLLEAKEEVRQWQV